MIPDMKLAKSVPHPVCSHENGSILIEGFPKAFFHNSFGIFAAGSRYHDYGIADRSLLLCDAAIKPEPGDVVLVFDGRQPLIHLYRPGAAEAADGEKRIVSDPAKIDAVVVSSFNFYR